DAGALLLDLADAADRDVLDQRLVELHALGQVGDRLREELLRVRVRQAALAGRAAAARGAKGGEDENVSHGASGLCACRVPPRRIPLWAHSLSAWRGLCPAPPPARTRAGHGTR